jgi:peptidyl-tRNA hydrolase
VQQPDVEPQPSTAPLALQLAARVEKVDPPTTSGICAAAALATIELLDDERSKPGGEWHEAVAAWNGARIRKIVRRARASAWQRAQEVDGVTVDRDGVEVRAFVPGPLDQAPPEVAKLQIQSSDLDEISPVSTLGVVAGLVIAVTPEVEMSWGKQAAQCAHAAQRAWMQVSDTDVQAWDKSGRPITIVYPDRALWSTLHERAVVKIRDGGFTEIPAGTNTTIAWWQ